MIGLIPLVVTGGIVKKFSDGMLGKERRVRHNAKRTNNRLVRKTRYAKGRATPQTRSSYPKTKYPPF